MASNTMLLLCHLSYIATTKCQKHNPNQETRRAAAVWFRAVRGTPWVLTDGYQGCVREGKHTMQMTGEGDPLGGGRGYSFLSIEKKVW